MLEARGISRPRHLNSAVRGSQPENCVYKDIPKSCFNILLVSRFTNECFGGVGLRGFTYSLHCISFLRRLNPTELI